MPRIPDSEHSSDVLGFAREAIEEGDSFLRAQPGYDRIAPTFDAINSRNVAPRASYLSQTSSNHLAKISLDLTASLTDVRPFWEFRTSNKNFERQSEVFNKLSLHWWLGGGIGQRGNDLNWADTIKYAIASGSGFAHQIWNPSIQDIDLMAEDPRDVLPIRPVSMHTIQDAFGALIRRERTVNYIRSLDIAEGKEHLIQPTRDGSLSSSPAASRAGRFLDWLGSPFRDRLFNSRPAREMPRIPVCDLYTLYLQDTRRNESVNPRYMGRWGTDLDGSPVPLTNWSYVVQKGELLYPRRRMLIFTDTVLLHDGPSIYWHGLFPLSKLTLDQPDPSKWLGKAPLWDLLPLQQTLDRLLRVLDDYFEKVARPDIIADKNAISKSFLDRLDTRRAGGKFSVNPLAGKGGFQLVYPQGVGIDLVMKMIEFVINEMDTLSGVRDLGQLMRLNQLPAGDTIEKMMESMTASVRLRSRVIESFMREFATQLMNNFAQFYTLPARLAILGADGATIEDFDYDPDRLVPADPSLPRMDAARQFLRQFTFHVAPGSLLSASAIERKLLYLQLWRGGAIDTETMLEAMDIPNIQQIMKRLAMQAEAGIAPNVNPAGRKASGQSMPRMTVKES